MSSINHHLSSIILIDTTVDTTDSEENSPNYSNSNNSMIELRSTYVANGSLAFANSPLTSSLPQNEKQEKKLTRTKKFYFPKTSAFSKMPKEIKSFIFNKLED